MANSRSLWLGAAVMTMAVGAAACGGTTSGGSPSAQPTPNVTTFQPARFDDLPKFPRSEPLSPRNEKDGVVARSFRATGASPEQVLDYYRNALAEQWTVLQAPERIGAGTYRGDWTSGDWQLRVSATEEPELDLNNASAERTVQYSLTLSPLPGP